MSASATDEREVTRIADKITRALAGENMCHASRAMFRVYAIAYAAHCVMHGDSVARALEYEMPILVAKIKENAEDMIRNADMMPVEIEGKRLH
jgi:hypothetical protein